MIDEPESWMNSTKVFTPAILSAMQQNIPASSTPRIDFRSLCSTFPVSLSTIHGADHLQSLERYSFPVWSHSVILGSLSPTRPEMTSKYGAPVLFAR